LTGREKKLAQKHAKMVADKQKRLNKDVARKDKNKEAARQSDADAASLAGDLGAVRI
jgi:hypothetical protein